MGARSFYYPPQSSTCVDCHMPLVDAADPAAKGGKVRSHRFPGANTAVPYVNHDAEQLKLQTDFLQDNIVSVDIFAASPVEQGSAEAAMRRRTSDAPVLATTFGVGEESEPTGGAYMIREVGRIAAPLDRVKPVLNPGDTVKVDVVVRTRKVGHLFPGGTVDSFDVWLELVAVDARGQVIFWSGMIEDEGRGPIEAGSHQYRSFLLDEHGNPINKRNAFQARSLLYVRLIPPGAADTVHFRMKVPEDVQGPIRLIAKLNYRKFSHFYTQFSYAGQPVPGDTSPFGKDFDDRQFTFDPANIPANVSGQIKDRIPTLPIVVMAQDEVELPVGSAETRWEPQVLAEDSERWNDYGIGLLLQGDLKGSEYAFQRVTEAKPDYADGWLNVARGLIQEGQTGAARPYVEKALAINASLARIHFFHALIQKAEGDYDGALASLRIVEAQYPKDRVVLNQIARILFLKRDYAQALEVLDRVARVDPEDLQMHYTRMLCYRGIGDLEKAEHAEILFRRFKADEASQTITASIRQQSPEDNNERQMIHEHESAPLNPGVRYDPSNSYPGADVLVKSEQTQSEETQSRAVAGGRM
jgi:tetratricopeptide (TPR) repeat protein